MQRKKIQCNSGLSVEFSDFREIKDSTKYAQLTDTAVLSLTDLSSMKEFKTISVKNASKTIRDKIS